jgi:tryptophan synthase beta subunit
VCGACAADAARLLTVAELRSAAADRARARVRAVCLACVGGGSDAAAAVDACVSLDCPAFYARMRAQDGADRAAALVDGLAAAPLRL